MLLQAASRMGELGAAGPFLYSGFYVLASLLVPSAILSLAASFLFGPWIGFAVMNLSAVAGACAGFFLARYLARSWIETRILSDPRWAGLDKATRRDGWKIVLLTRIAPIFPYLLLNYGYGLSAVRFRDYFWATWVGMIPSGIVFAYLGSAARSLAELGQNMPSMSHSWIFWAGLIVAIVATSWIAIWAKREWNKAALDRSTT